jgi:nucleoside-diphosphate-sugar epimerase
MAESAVNVPVPGGAGYIGSHTAKALARNVRPLPTTNLNFPNALAFAGILASG